MTSRSKSIALAALLPAGVAPATATGASMVQAADYPETRRVDVVEEHFGQAVSDPYRWLESDVRSDHEVAAWVAAQNSVTDGYLAALPGRQVFRERLAALFDSEQFIPPHQRGNRYFHTYNPGLANQTVLFVREGLDGQDRLLIDPNAWSNDGATAMAQWAASDDGTHVAYGVQEGGTDWRTIRVMNVGTGAVLDDQVNWARFTSISWTRDGTAFVYSRYPEPGRGTSQAGIANHAVYLHVLGTPQSRDRLLYATPDRPQLVNIADRSEGGRYLAIYSTPGSNTNALSVIDLDGDDREPRTLVDDFDAEWSVIGHHNSKLYLVTTQHAERRKIVTLDLADAQPHPIDLVGEDAAVLESAWLVGGRLLVCYIVDARTEIRRFTLDGAADGVVALPGIGRAGGFQGTTKNQQAFFAFTSFNMPVTVYRYDVASNVSSVWAAPETSLDLQQIAVEQRFYRAQDGTSVPMFIVRRRDVTGPAPTLLYGYGGFGINVMPAYSVPQLAWIEQGGVVAIANIRGGGEYGEAWHRAGRLANKQVSFDDFIAAGSYLKAEGIATPHGLAVQGESHGGLLVGAVVNQRPELFDAALPCVGVMDMLRFNQFTGGQLWMADYGNPANEADFRNLAAYSPYHNVAAGADYPAVLAITADTDDRVVPGHTFKYIAALQAADIGPKPHLVRIDTRAGHGAGKPIDKVIAEVADMWAFAAHWTGLEVAPRN